MLQDRRCVKNDISFNHDRSGQLRLLLDNRGQPNRVEATLTKPAKDVPAPNRNHKRRQRTRDSILAAADRVFREKGVTATTVSDITEAADVAYGSFYNHFKTMDDVVAAVAEKTIGAAAEVTGEIFAQASKPELLPSIGARVVMRVLTQDPTIRWLLERPYIFVAEWYKMASPFMLQAEKDAVASGLMNPVGGHQTWIRLFPWLLISELNEALASDDLVAEEDRIARISIRMLGIDERLADELVEKSRDLVSSAGLPTPAKSRNRRKATAAH